MAVAGLGIAAARAQEAAPATSRGGNASFGQAMAYVKAQAAKEGAAKEGATGKGELLAVHLMPEGHWQFANAKGEVITARPQEVKRALETLAPGLTDPAAPRPNLYLTDEAAVLAAPVLSQLPAQTSLHVLLEGVGYRLARRPAGGSEPLLAEIRPNLWLEMKELAAVRDAAWQLARKLDRNGVRVLSLEPDGPRALPSLARFEAGSKVPLPDPVDPYGMAKALSALRGQKVLLTGRIDGELLWFQSKGKSEQSLLLRDVRGAAEAYDIALVVLNARSPRQPGERTWALLRVGLPGLQEALAGSTFADFYDALGASQGKYVIRALEPGSGRTRLEAVPVRTLGSKPGEERGIGGLWKDVVTGVIGTLAPDSVRMDLPSRDRQSEIERRWLPGIPSLLQIGYAALMAIGLAALRVAWGWWGRIWPVESAGDYKGRAGHLAARAIRGLVFLVLFVPVAAPLAFPVQILRLLGDTLRGIGAILRGTRPAARSQQ